MLFDANGLADNPFPSSFDIVVVGAGAAGITLALEMMGSGKSVCLIESGGMGFEPDCQQLYQCIDTGAYSAAVEGRLRQLGGATNLWGGRCGMLDELDMAEKPWAPDSFWPLARSELDGWYDRARLICGFDAPWPTLDRVLERLPTTIRTQSSIVTPYVWWLTPQEGENGLNFAKRYRDSLAADQHTTLLLHMNLTRLVTSESGNAIVAAEFCSLAGKKLEIRASQFVLACSGIENSRMLLIGDGVRPIGNEKDVVGRYFMQHPRAPAGIVAPSQRRSEMVQLFNWHVFGASGDGAQRQCQVGLTLTPEARKSQSLMNASFAFIYNYPVTGGKQAIQDIGHDLGHGHWPPHLGSKVTNILLDLESLDDLMKHALYHREYPFIESASIVVDLEQLPDRDSRITLSDKKDRLGSPEAVINWKLNEQERKTARVGITAAASELARLGLGRTRLEPWIESDSQDLSTALSPTYHFLGGTRMASDSAKGVVDRTCKVHSVDNLYIAGSSVFPSGGHINPTLTIVALAARLADHLKGKA
jgi:choline dehydrogenase-like flavoprotein